MSFLPKPLEQLTLWEPSGECVRFTSEGHPYEELSCLFPSIGWTYFEFEKNFDTIPIHAWVKNNLWFSPVAVSGYAIMLYFGPKYMKERKSWNWRKALIAWNFILAVFSTIGFLRTLPALVHGMFAIKGYDWLCTAPENNFLAGSTGMWIELWVVSKVPEFIDTFFLIIHKKKIIFLHPFHHLLTFAASFWGFRKSPPPITLLGICMNYGVHSIMYLYYMLMAMRCKPKWFKPVWVTSAQFGQMIVGVSCGSVFTFLFLTDMPGECREWLNEMLPMAIFIYVSFGLLFGQLYFSRYFSVGIKAVKTKTKTV